MLLFIPFLVGDQGNDRLNLDTITVQNVDDLTRLESFDVPNAIALDWSSDSEQLVVSSYEGIWLLDLNQMQLQQINLNEDIVGYEVEFAEDSNRIIVQGSAEVILYNLDTLEFERITAPSGNIRAVNDDGTLYAAIDVEWDSENDVVIAQTVRIYDLPDSALRFEIPVILYDEFCFYACHVGVAFSPDNLQFVFTAAVPEVESAFVNLETGEKRAMPHIGHWGTVYSSDGFLTASTSGQPGYIADALILINTETAEIVAQADLYASSSPEFNYSNDLVAIGVYNENAPNPDEATGFIYFFRVNDELNQIAELSFARPPTAIEFSPDGRMLAVSDGNGRLSLWGVENAE
jgi:WD40 repeat protein